jgi:hypothetical protein
MSNPLILEISLKKLTEEFDKFILECMDEDGKPKIPSYKALARARGCIPSHYESAHKKGDKK